MPKSTSSGLVAIRMATRRGLAAAILSAWERGEAVLPIDPALPNVEARRLLQSARPHILRMEDGDEKLADPLPVAEGTRVVVGTAGSTGEPKLVELSASALRSAALASNERLGAAWAKDTWLCCLPLSHVAGLGILHRSVLIGHFPIVLEGFSAKEVAGTDASFVSLVPPMLFRLLEEGVDLSGFKTVLLGGARIPPSLLERARALGANVVTTYGMTETCGGVVYDGVPLEGSRVEIDEGGLIRLAGPTLMTCYRGDPGATAAVLDDGWFKTSDVGALKEGRLQVIGRADDVIITGGEKVDPSEVEAALEEHESVVEALVIGEPDTFWGERVVALVVRARDSEEADLRTFLGERLASYKIPKEFRPVTELPRLPSGKLRRRLPET